MTDRERWVIEMLRMFNAGNLSGDLTVRFRDGVPVEAVPAPRYKAPQRDDRSREGNT